MFLLVFFYDTFAPKRALGALGTLTCVFFAALTVLGFCPCTAADTSVLLMDVAQVFAAMLDDMHASVPTPVIAARFHSAFVDAIVNVAELVRATYGIEIMALAGGVFMNRYLMERTLARLQERGFTVALNKELPPNDASISYGQAVLGLQAQHEE